MSRKYQTFFLIKIFCRRIQSQKDWCGRTAARRVTECCERCVVTTHECHGAVFWWRRKSETDGRKFSVIISYFHTIFSWQDRILAIMGRAGQAGGIKERDYGGCFFLSTFRLFCFGFPLKEKRPYIFWVEGLKQRIYNGCIASQDPVQIQGDGL